MPTLTIKNKEILEGVRESVQQLRNWNKNQMQLLTVNTDQCCRRYDRHEKVVKECNRILDLIKIKSPDLK